MPVSLKESLKNKNLTIGSWLSLGYPSICEIMAKAGFDWLVVDLEHTNIDYNEASQLIRIIDLAGSVPLVRVGENNPTMIKRVMDSGAHGVVVPMVNSRKEAEQAIESVYYPPIGKRGVGLFRAQKYGLGFDEYSEWLLTEAVVIVQIEHIKGVENLEDIISVDGVDGFIIGPYDLSGSLKLPGQFDHSLVKEALQEVEKVMLKSEKVGGYHIVHPNPSELESKTSKGYKFIAYGDDMVFFAEKVRDESEVLTKKQLLKESK